MSDEDTFLHSIHKSPGDDTTRLVYADWLKEREDPRAEFLRLQVALQRSESGTQRDELRERLFHVGSGLDLRWITLVDQPQCGWRIVRKRTDARVYGKAVPAFIHNGSYYLSAVEVCSDGAINCWGFVDVPLFRGKLAQGWVVPRAEVGGTLSIHNLGQARVEAAEWDRTPSDIERDVLDVIRELNPKLDGLLDMQGTDVELCDGIRYGKGAGLGRGRPYRATVSGAEVLGDELPVFEEVAGGCRLRRWLIYADGLTQLGYATELLPIDAIGQMFAEGRLTLSVPPDTWVTLDGLGRFQAGEGYWSIEPDERLREASDVLDQLNGGTGAIYRCIRAHMAYKNDPGPERRESLRIAYDAVPKHLRRYCGDMGSKDGPIRRILGEFGGGSNSDE